MNVDLKVCPILSTHRVYGGFPEYVCPECGTEWRVIKRKGQANVHYTRFDADGKVIRKWMVPLEYGFIKRRRLSA